MATRVPSTKALLLANCTGKAGYFCTDRRRSPCILGWPAFFRAMPYQPIASKLELSKKFAENVRVSCTLRGIELQCVLGYQGLLTAQAGITASYSLDRYTMSAGPANISLAAAVAQRSPIFMYCEERKVHLAVSGADVIETFMHSACTGAWIRSATFQTPHRC